MAYVISALVGRPAPIGHAAAALGLPEVAIPQGFVLLPGPHPDEDDPADASDRNTGGQPFHSLASRLERAAITASSLGAIAYLEAEFFAGPGTQAAVVWDDGRVVLGPLQHDGDDPAPEQPPMSDWPINTALRRLGVRAGEGSDEFDALDLGRHRSTEGWREP